jgi:hypothetical protein
MRKVVVPVSILAVALGVWLANRQPAFDAVPPESIVTTPVVTRSPEIPPVVQTERVKAIAASELPIETGAPPLEPLPARGPVPATSPAITLEMWDQRGLGLGLEVFPHLRGYEKDFLIEPLDPVWSRSREAEILGQLAQISGLGLLAVEVECRTSVCRMQLTHGVVSAESEHLEVPVRLYTELSAKLGYEDRIPTGFARVDAATVASLAYLPRQ